MPARISTVGVVGLGTMGAGIVHVCAQAGFQTIGYELTPELADRGRATVERNLARAVERGRLDAQARDATLDRMRTTVELGDLAGCDLVVEAVVEDPSVKREVFAELDALLERHAILATNTSALSVTELAAATSRPQRVVGMHFFNPAPVLPLVEIVRTELTDPEVLDAAFEFAKALGKEPIRCDDTPGFVVNRILVPLLNDCVRVLDEAGVSPDDLDRAMTHGTNWPIGPCALIDLIGVDVHVHVAEALWHGLREPRMSPPPRLVRMAKAGLLGRKSGRGFFEYER